jgi:hypothetical protein
MNLLASLALILAAGVSPLATSELRAGDTRVILEVSAKGGRNLSPFDVNDRWKVHWEAEKSIFISIMDAESGKFVDVAATQPGGGSGSSFQAKGGYYFLKIQSTGGWTVTVVELPR